MGTTRQASPSAVRPWTVAVAGMVALAVAMGIGRFAFTPIMPMMLHDGVVDLPGASGLATANYLGYLLGAVLCALQPWLWATAARLVGRPLPTPAFVTLVRAGLLLTGVLTLAMVWPQAQAWPWLRFLAGVTSAVVFVFTSGWCLSRLAKLGKPSLAGLIYMGPGAGIVLSGLLASGMVAAGWAAASAWLVFGLLAFALAALVFGFLQGGDDRLKALALRPDQRLAQSQAGCEKTTNQAAHDSQPKSSHLAQMPLLTVAYGLAGFGYIITATFLPVIARAALPGSAWLDLFWPVFGSGIMLGAWMATHVRPGRDLRWLLTGCYLVQALGVGIPLLSPSLAGFALGSLLLGLPFTALTFFAMQEVRRLKPETAASFMALLTATYGSGQVAGPWLVAVLLRSSAGDAPADPAAVFRLALAVAAASLLLGAALYAWMTRAYPWPSAAAQGTAHQSPQQPAR